jgi:tetratricopeptide (TPR) repeat protein
MKTARIAILLLAVAAAHGASRNKVESAVVRTGADTGDIAAARAAVDRATAEHGAEHPVTALMLRNLALAMQQAGYSNYAEHYARQSLAILERRFGPNDASLVPALNVLAEAEVSQGKLADAREAAVRAVAIGPDAEAHYGTALHNLAAVSQLQGDLTTATEYYRQALAVREKLLPAGHPHILLTRAALEQAERSERHVASR